MYFDYGSEEEEAYRNHLKFKLKILIKLKEKISKTRDEEIDKTIEEVEKILWEKLRYFEEQEDMYEEDFYSGFRRIFTEYLIEFIQSLKGKKKEEILKILSKSIEDARKELEEY